MDAERVEGPEPLSVDRSKIVRPRGCNDGKYGVREHLVVEGRCYTCEGEEAARQARLAERGIYVGRFR